MSAGDHSTTEAGHAEGAMHVASGPLLLAVWGTLLVLTAVTVGVPLAEGRFHFELGAASLWIALGIATVKAALVASTSCICATTSRSTPCFFLAGLLFVVLLISLTLMDTLQYRPSVLKPRAGSRAAGALTIRDCGLGIGFGAFVRVLRRT